MLGDIGAQFYFLRCVVRRWPTKEDVGKESEKHDIPLKVNAGRLSVSSTGDVTECHDAQSIV